MTAPLDFESLTLTEIIQLNDELSQVLKRRFEKNLALSFTDVVGSTAYFGRFGDEAGRALQQRHFDLLGQVLSKAEGRVVDTAGDGAFCCYPHVEPAVGALVELQEKISEDNVSRAREHQLSLRIGVHWGPVLTDGTLVTGDAVNLCSRLTGTGAPGEIRLSKVAFLELSNTRRVKCRALPAVEVKGIGRPVELVLYEWRDRSLFPAAVRVEETGDEITLPTHDTISFGRLKERDGIPANDIVLILPDKQLTQQISRWHFELRRGHEGFVLRAVSDQKTEVDGTVAAKGADVPIRPGSVVRLSGVMTLTFLADPLFRPSLGDDTLLRDTLSPR
jgi:class 3 adenylate cyclase